MKSEQILEKLSTLDPANDEHWNQDGQARLDAVGQGVSRKDILAVAPLFNRTNAVVPEPEEVPHVPTYEEKLVALQAKLDRARIDVEAASRAKEDADLYLAEANKELEKIRDEQKALDTRSDAEINKELLDSDFRHRLARAQQHSQLRELMAIAGVSGKDIKMLTLSPADRGIAERVIRERKERLRQGANK